MCTIYIIGYPVDGEKLENFLLGSGVIKDSCRARTLNWSLECVCVCVGGGGGGGFRLKPHIEVRFK